MCDYMTDNDLLPVISDIMEKKLVRHSFLSSHTADITVFRRGLTDIKDSAEYFRICFADSGHKHRFVDVNVRADEWNGIRWTAG